MTTGRTESPIDECDRELTARRARAAGTVQRWAGLWLALHAGIPAVAAVVMVVLNQQHEYGAAPGKTVTLAEDAARLVALVSLAASVPAAIAAAVVTFRLWPLLGWERRARGLVPWVIFAAEGLFMLGVYLGY